MTSGELAQHLATIYDQGKISRHQRLTSIYRPYYCPVSQVLKHIPEGSRVLDIGCGTGPMLYLMRDFCNIEFGRGIDFNKDSIDTANAVNSDDRLEFRQREALEFAREPFEEFDVIFCFDVLHHIPYYDKATFLSRVTERMRPGALFVIKDLDSRPRRKAFANRVTDYLSTRSRVSYWRRSALVDFLHSHRLSVTHHEDLSDWIWSHYLVIAKK